MKRSRFADDPLALLMAYEVWAAFSHRAPLLSTICRKHPWATPVLFGAVWLHITKGEQ